MKINIGQIKDKLVEKGLKVTPQRIAILEAIYMLDNHPDADRILDYIKNRYPGIASATVYKILDTLVEKQIILRVKTDKDSMRYDGILENHHHLYNSETNAIRDYWNEDLDQLLKDYFAGHKIENFEISEIKLQISGKFLKNQGKELK
jgi:Fur family peroxide stress response transcriptional regulator